jgi:hypothetical protein|tara:strand:+ start:359 stop:940 length:582 start_codon:yes stop_codon:yes gene_type:complete
MKEVKLIIPDNWNDITIRTYQEYVKIQEGKGSEKNKIVKSLALLCGTSPFVVKKMAYKDLVEIMTIIKKMIDTEPTEEDFKKTFTLNKIEYGFCPNLNNLTTGEYIDLESYCKKPIENLHTIMSILYRKVTNRVNERYAIEPYNPDEFKEELFKDCPMSIALSSLGFFLTLGEELAKISLQFLAHQKMTQPKA